MATAASIVFGLLVVATVGAFFVTQRLKRSTPILRNLALPRYISPNGDGRKDRIKIRFRLPKGGRVTVSIVNSGGDPVRVLADRHLSKGRHVFHWNGRNGRGSVPPDGTYYLRVALADEGRATQAPRGTQLVTKPPRPKLVGVSPARIAYVGDHAVTIRYEGPTRPPATFSVYRTSGPGAPELVDRFTGGRGVAVGMWGGGDEHGKPVPPGTYAFGVTVQNRAGVSGSAPAQLPPVPSSAAPETGLTISGPQAAGPLEPVRAGSTVALSLPGTRGAVRYRLARIGDTRKLATGRGRGPSLRVPIPRTAAGGLYVARLRTAQGSASVPLVVRGGGAEPGVLVVLPAITWQGQNPVDDDADGFPNTLATEASVGTGRPFALGRLPVALTRETAPLLQFLDSRHDRYSLTTDLALARGQGPRLAGHSGVIFAGSALWLSEQLDSQLRGYVEGGGRLASFGTDAFRRTVQVTATSLADPSAPQEANVFGEQVKPASSEAAPLVVHSDALGLFAGSDGFVGLFTRFEQQEALVGGAENLTDAGREPGHPAFVGYRLGGGTVIRVGTPEWLGALGGDAEVAAVTESVWRLLSR
jgi:hypothetical protein